MNQLRLFVFTIWSAGLAALLLLGRYSLFIRAQLWPLLLGTLLMFVLFLVAMGIRRRRGASATAAAWARSLLLLLPLAYVFPLMSRASASGLNSFALQKRSLGLSSGLDSSFESANGPLPTSSVNAEGETVSIGVLARHFRKLSGKHVITDGRIYHDDSVAGGQLQIYRFVVVCCAADAMPVQVVVKGADSAAFKNDQWVRVEGTVGSMQQDGAAVPVINATRVIPIAAPPEPYLSPYRF